MGDIVASRSRRMLADLKAKDEAAFNLFEDGVTKLASTLEEIEKLLNRGFNSSKVVDSVKTIRHHTHDIEDILETWVVIMETVCISEIKKERGIMRPFKRWLGGQDDGMDIKKLIEVFAFLVNLRAGLENTWFQETFPEAENELEIESSVVIERGMASQGSFRWTRQMYAHAVDEHFLERKEDFKLLVSRLTDHEKEHRVVSIWGVKGLGKTSLARKLYIHPLVRSHFEAFAWVNLTQDYQIISLAQDILNQLTARAVQMSVAEEQKKKGAEDPPTSKLTESLMKKGAAIQKESAPEKSEGAENGKLLHSLKKLGSALLKRSGKGFYTQNSAEPSTSGNKLLAGAVQMSVAEEQKKGSEEKNKGAEDPPTSKFTAAQKESAPEKSEGEENGKLWKKLGAVVLKKIGKGPPTSGLKGKKEGEDLQPKSREQSMMDKLKGILRQKRCLLVIDGISEPSQWSRIRSEFLMEDTDTKILKDTDTKILLTTDDKTTANSDEVHHHELKALTEEESWKLLQKYVRQVPELGVVPVLGRAMVSKCGGLPSKISSLGRILSKMDFNEWHKVNDEYVNGYLEREDDQIQPTAAISNDHSVPSYDNLSYCLKQIFLYLAIFKGDEGVDEEDLSFLWMAEGIAPPQEQGESVMDTANYYLQELNSRGMLQGQVDELSVNKGVKRLWLSKHARELSLYKGDEEGFWVKVVDFFDGKQPRFDSLSLDNTTRRLVIHFDEHSSTWEYDFDLSTNLRSLLFINSSQKYVDLPVPNFGNYKFKEYSLLRVVHFVRCKFEDRKLPEGIAELSNLRYLGVIYCDLDGLPPSITNLRNLQVLNVRAYDDARITMPGVIISQLVGLKHLRLPNNLDHEQSHPLKLDGLQDLETLIGFNADIHDINSLSQLQKLRHLEIHASSNDSLKSIIHFIKSHGARVRTSLLLWDKCDFTSLEGFILLEEVLMCPNLDALTISMVPIHKFPNCGTFASKEITQIKLIGCKLREDPMEALGKFPKLRKLCLGYGAFVGAKMRVGDGGFRELTYLEFRCLPYLEELSVEKGAMKKLSAPTYSQCHKFKESTQESRVDSSLNNSVMEPAPPNAIAGDCEIDVHHIFSWHHILKALGSFILYLSGLTNRSRNANCLESACDTSAH